MEYESTLLLRQVSCSSLPQQTRGSLPVVMYQANMLQPLAAAFPLSDTRFCVQKPHGKSMLHSVSELHAFEVSNMHAVLDGHHRA